MIFRVTFKKVVDVQAKDEDEALELAEAYVENESNNFEQGVAYLESSTKPVKLNLINVTEQ